MFFKFEDHCCICSKHIYFWEGQEFMFWGGPIRYICNACYKIEVKEGRIQPM